MVTRLVAMLREPPAVRNTVLEVLERTVPDALDCVVPGLKSPDPHVRKCAVDLLGKTADARVVPALMPLLSDPDTNVRAAAAEALGRLRAGEAVPQLVGLLGDTEWVAVTAISALGEIGEKTCVPWLMEVLRTGSEAMQCAAVEALARVDRDGVSAPACARLIGSPNPELRGAIVTALVAMSERAECEVWATKDPTTWLAVLGEILRDLDSERRLAAITALGRLRDRRGTRLILNACREWGEPGEETVTRAVAALEAIGDAAPLIETLRPDETDGMLGKVLILALGRMRCTDAVPALVAVRLGSPNWELRKLAVQALALIGTDEAMQAVHDAIEDPTGYVRCEAVRALASTGAIRDRRCLLERLPVERYPDVRDEIVAVLAAGPTFEVGVSAVALLRHPRADVRFSAAQLIGRMALPEGLEPLLDALNDPEWSVRRAVAEALGSYDDQRASEALSIALSDEHEQVRLAAVVGLSRADRREARAALIALGLRDADVWVRYRTIERLGSMKAEEAVPALRQIVADPREPELVRQAAEQALAAIDRLETRA